MNTTADAPKSVRDTSQSLTARSLSALKWSYVGVAVRVVSQVVAQIALARLLGAEAFGVFALAILVVGVGGIAIEMGLGSALVQKAEITSADVQKVYTRVVGAAWLMVFLVLAFAPFVASALNDPRVADVLRGMTPVFLLQAISVAPLSLLKRELAFKVIQVTYVASYVAGFMIVGVGLAIAGAGVWSLVAAWIVQTSIVAITAFSLRPHSLVPMFSLDGSALGGFGIRALLTNMSNWLIENVDNALVGKIYGAAALGLYSVSYNLVRTPANHLVVTLQSVLFPSSARAQCNQSGLQRAYLTVISGVTLVALPVFCGAAVVADTIVAALFGHRWSQAAPMLVPLSLAMALHAPMAVAGPVLWGTGAPGAELKVQAWTALLFIIALLIAGRFSAVAMAWSVCAVYAVRLVGMTIAVTRHIRIPISAPLLTSRGAIVAAIISTSLLFGLDMHLQSLAPIARLALEIGAAWLTLMGIIWLWPRVMLSEELASVAARLLVQVSGFSNWLRRLEATRNRSDAESGL